MHVAQTGQTVPLQTAASVPEEQMPSVMQTNRVTTAIVENIRVIDHHRVMLDAVITLFTVGMA